MLKTWARCASGASAALFGGNALLSQVRFRSNKAILAAKQREEAGLPPIDEWAYNYIEKKNGLFKPPHTVEEQIAYMNSNVYHETYKGLPVFRSYRRNARVQYILLPKPRLYCIDKHGRYNVNYACPICRDEYLFFDYRNPKLIEMFLVPGTDLPFELRTTGLCREQYILLKAQLLKAKEHGTIVFPIEFRYFNYKDWYPQWELTQEDNDAIIDPKKYSRLRTSVEEIHEEPSVQFETHNRDVGTDWDEWWIRHDKFAKKIK